jgi:hypothetical protein
LLGIILHFLFLFMPLPLFSLLTPLFLI